MAEGLPKGKTWENALQVDLMAHGLAYHPEETNERWLSLVKASFQTQVMSPVTSYISLENEAQKAALLAKQKQVLAAKQSLDAGEELQRMSEPDLVIWLLVLASMGGIYFLRKKWKQVKDDDLTGTLPL